MYKLEDYIERIPSYTEFKKRIKPLYVINSYTVSRKMYDKFKDEMTRLSIGAFHSGQMMTHKVKFKFYADDKEVQTLEFRHFLYNVYLWQSMVDLHGLKVMNKDMILLPEQIPNVNDYIYKISLKPLIDNSVDTLRVQEYDSEIVYDLSSIGVYFGLIMALHFEDKDLFRMMDEYGDLMKPKDYSQYQPDEIEKMASDLENELVKRILADKDNPMRQIIAGGNPFKVKQLRELLLTVSLRPDLDGTIVTRPINKGLIMGALETPSDVYTDALVARKPQLINNKDMGIIGYFIKALNILTRTLEVSTLKYDCGTRHLVNYEVKTAKHLKLIAGKFMEINGDLRQITPRDTALIGKIIKVRSVITCCAGENEVCPVCVGKLINFNWDIPEGFAEFVTAEYAQVMEQSKLSSKHIMKAKPESIEFNKPFYKFFELDREEIRLSDEIKERKNLMIVIDPEDIYKVDLFDADTTYNNYIDTGKFTVVDSKLGDSWDIEIAGNKKIFICTDIMGMMKDGKLHLKDIDSETPIFEVSIMNEDATRPYDELMEIIDLENKPIDVGPEDDLIDTVAQRFYDLFVEAKIDLNMSAGEIILNRLCRVPGDVAMRPKFNKKKKPEVHFYSLGKCIEENSSPTLGMIYEQLLRQLTRVNLETRNSPSFADPFFKEDISMDPIMSLIDED